MATTNAKKNFNVVIFWLPVYVIVTGCTYDVTYVDLWLKDQGSRPRI